jgi:GMP synthase-like glutamine amidotransferase
MIERNRLFLLAVFAVTTLVTAPGCNRQPVTGQNAMPDNPSLSPGDKRKAMVQWHQQHDKLPEGASRPANSAKSQNAPD